VTNFKMPTPTVRPRARLASTRASLAIAAFAAAAMIAGCGSSGGSSTITVGNENTADNTIIHEASSTSSSSTSTSSTPSSTTASVKTPTSGPLSTEPKITVPTGPAPTKLETKELIKGTGAEAKAGDTVTVNDVGVLYANGKQFENTFTRKEPSTFPLSGLIAGFSKGIPGMKVGGRRELIIPASLGYGAKGSSQIPANSALVFVVDLLGV
jgi:peptidylprolyl isomerase